MEWNETNDAELVHWDGMGTSNSTAVQAPRARGNRAGLFIAANRALLDCTTTDFSRALTKKEAPLPGLNKKSHHRICFSDRRSPAAARAFTASLLFTFGDETGLLDGLPLLLLLLLAGLPPAAALLLATAALLVFLLILIGHQVTPWFDQRITFHWGATFLNHVSMTARRFRRL